MTKDVVLTTRINSNLKKEAENILKKLGLNSSTAISLFYTNIILNKGLPFRLRLDSVPSISDVEQNDIEEILNKRTNADRKIVNSESIEIDL
ncbi:MAG: type II toxin-antitoxin system RelB/DinJ family antitoxin [Melioribacteraceae bacterium]|nr:MAG: type II toxin-antitoxin system RelB/DinJ family antitoxin [Melioribacteraceae bacterium]